MNRWWRSQFSLDNVSLNVTLDIVDKNAKAAFYTSEAVASLLSYYSIKIMINLELYSIS